MKRYLPLLLVAFVFLSGCAVKNGGAPTPEQVEARRDQLNELSSSKTEHPYLGAKPIVRQTDGEDIPVLNASVTLKQKGTLSEIAASLSTIAPLSAQVSDTDADEYFSAKNLANGFADFEWAGNTLTVSFSAVPEPAAIAAVFGAAALAIAAIRRKK